MRNQEVLPYDIKENRSSMVGIFEEAEEGMSKTQKKNPALVDAQKHRENEN